MSRTNKQKSIPQKAFDFLSSYGLAVVLLALLLALTFFGTFAQVEHGLYDASNMYFESFIVVDDFKGIPLALPGVYLVSIVLFVNLLCGAIIRARKSWRRPGMIIAHGGILFILFSGFVAFHFTREGSMLLYKGDRADEIYNLTDWSIEVAKHGADGETLKTYVIEPDDLKPLYKKGARRVFHSAEIPFELELYGAVRNILNFKLEATGLVQEGAKANAGASLSGGFVEGFALAAQRPNKQAERNQPGTYIKVRRDGEELAHTLLLGGNGFTPRPLTVEVGEETWSVNLTRRRFSLPFGLELEKFEKEDHPGTQRAREYSSDVVRVDDGVPTDRYHISMNRPMRYGGFTVYQASWGPQNAAPGDPLYTTLAVAHNPADQWPKWATYIVAIGMAIHFFQKLVAYLRRAGRANRKQEDTP